MRSSGQCFVRCLGRNCASNRGRPRLSGGCRENTTLLLSLAASCRRTVATSTTTSIMAALSSIAASTQITPCSRRRRHSSLAQQPEESSGAPASSRPRLQKLQQRLKEEAPVPQTFAKSSPPIVTQTTAAASSSPILDITPTSAASSTSSNIHTLPLATLRTQLAHLPDPSSVLTDRFHRHHNYLRLSLTERCNLRCTYCMPAAGVPLQASDRLLSTQELLDLAALFVDAGVTKFRLTGGEPTLRRDLVEIVQGLRNLLLSESESSSDTGNRSRTSSSNSNIGMTTNGVALPMARLRALHEAGLTSVNLSLDTVDPEKFARMTRRPAAYLQRVWQCLEDAMALQQEQQQLVEGSVGLPFTVKLNVVVMRGTNDTEVADFVELSNQYPGLKVRFIEYMPFSDNGWEWDTCVPYRELLDNLPEPLQAVPSDDPHDTTKWYTTSQGGSVGFITSMSQHFCGTCNRLRLTTDGQIKVCLFDGSSNVSLRDALREGWTPLELRKLIHTAVQTKHAVLGGHDDPTAISKDAANNRPMTLIGG